MEKRVDVAAAGEVPFGARKPGIQARVAGLGTQVGAGRVGFGIGEQAIEGVRGRRLDSSFRSEH
jgi:hypothetical protein